MATKLRDDDPRHHTHHVTTKLKELVDHLREDIGKVQDPKAQAIDVLAPTPKSSRAAIYNGCAWLICPGSPAHRQQSRRTACRWCTGGVGDCAALYRRRRADVDEHHRRRDQRPPASAHTVVISAHGAFGLRSIMIDVR